MTGDQIEQCLDSESQLNAVDHTELRSVVEAVPRAGDAFVVADETSANWVVRKIQDARIYAERVAAWADLERRRAGREETYFLMRFGRQLEDWTRMRLDQQVGKRKSIHLPAGTLGFRKQLPRLNVIDETTFLQWARENLPEAIRVTVTASGREAAQLREWQRIRCPSAQIEETVAKSIVNPSAFGTGEVPGGTEWLQPADKFYVK
jgi:hypothetical protein